MVKYVLMHMMFASGTWFTFPPVTLADRPRLLQRLLGVLWSV